MAPRGRLSTEERDSLAMAAAQRYKQGESWAGIARDYNLTSAYVRRLTTARHPINYHRWGQQPTADIEQVNQLRDNGCTLDEIAEAMDCSRQAIRTALETAGHTTLTRYPRLSQRRNPTSSETATLIQLYEVCPQAPRSREGFRNTRGPEGRALAEACRSLVDDGIPMAALSAALGRGPTWVHWLLGTHDLRPAPHRVQTTSRRTRGPTA